jgi:hypothetical protein
MAKKKKSGKKRSAAPKKKKELRCDICGTVVRVIEDCNCMEPCDMLCCGQQMTPC